MKRKNIVELAVERLTTQPNKRACLMAMLNHRKTVGTIAKFARISLEDARAAVHELVVGGLVKYQRYGGYEANSDAILSTMMDILQDLEEQSAEFG